MRLRLPESWIKSASNKQYFDEDLEQDALDLLTAAAALEVKEFTLFELAYREWYGRRPLAHVIEAHFSDYMFNNVVPAWVRSYSRRVVELHSTDTLDPREFGIYKPLPSKRLVFIGRMFIIFLIVVYLVVLFLINMDPPSRAESLFGRADEMQEPGPPRYNAIP